MSHDWNKLAGSLLDRAANQLSFNGCNDWPWPEGWTPEQRRELVVAMHESNFRKPLAKFSPNELEDMENQIVGEIGPPDWWLAMFLGRELMKG